MTDELEAGELRPLTDRIEAIRRRWSEAWIIDEGWESLFASNDIRTVLEGYDALKAQLAKYDTAIAEAYASGVNRGYRGYGLGGGE